MARGSSKAATWRRAARKAAEAAAREEAAAKVVRRREFDQSAAGALEMEIIDSAAYYAARDVSAVAGEAERSEAAEFREPDTDDPIEGSSKKKIEEARARIVNPLVEACGPFANAAIEKELREKFDIYINIYCQSSQFRKKQGENKYDSYARLLNKGMSLLNGLVVSESQLNDVFTIISNYLRREILKLGEGNSGYYKGDMDDAAVLQRAADIFGLPVEVAARKLEEAAAEIATRETTGSASAEPRPKAAASESVSPARTAQELFGLSPSFKTRRYSKGDDFSAEELASQKLLQAADSIVNARTRRTKKGVVLSDEEIEIAQRAARFTKQARKRQKLALT
jgi:hypothetical protein